MKYIKAYKAYKSKAAKSFEAVESWDVNGERGKVLMQYEKFKAGM